jgi:hypothetical protein
MVEEDQEGRLRGILRVMRIAKHGSADAQDHRAMPLDQHLKGGGVPPGDESIEELPVGPRPDGPKPENLMELSRSRDRPAVCHPDSPYGRLHRHG